MNSATHAPALAASPASSPAGLLDTREALIREVRRGLVHRPRSLAPWMFYDARGSILFERITTLPEYYLTRIEREIFEQFADRIVASTDASQPVRVLELGAGTAAKTGILLRAAVRRHGEVTYMPVDVSPDALNVASESIVSVSNRIRLEPVVANYVTHPLQVERFEGRTLAMYIGSSIGNFSPEEARTILCNLRGQLQAGDALLLGTDMVKDEATLLAAYDDRAGVTAAFNLNVLDRLNRELAANFHTACFAHRAIWNQAESRMEMHLVSKHAQDVWIAGAETGIHLQSGETIHTENSYKFTRDAIHRLLADSGFEPNEAWTDPREWFTVTLAGIAR